MNQFVQTPDAPSYARDSRNSDDAADIAENQDVAKAAAPKPGDADFVDRRRGGDSDGPTRERRQFANSHQELSPEASQLATAIDEYKLRHRRRFITYEEMLGVIKSLGYKLD